jgi:penicillin-binding protein 2X
MNNRKRVGILLFATSIGLFFLFAARFSYIVIGGKIVGTSLKEKTTQLYNGTQTVKAKRGTIYDRNGKVIAQDATSYSLYAILATTYTTGNKKLYAQEKDFNKLATILKDNLNIDKKTSVKILNSGLNKDGSWKKFQVEFGNQGTSISYETKKAIEKDMKKAGVKGLYFTDHPARIYPNGTFASHFIGYAVADDDESGMTGILGLEKDYDDILSGTDGKITYKKDYNQNPLPGTVKQTKKAVDGDDIYTTLDSRLQTYLDTLMKQVYDEDKPKDMMAVLASAKTGEILAMTQEPSFDPETKEGMEDANMVWRNMLVEDAFEPGSTMKPFTVSASITEKQWNENESYVSGSITVGDTTINDHDQGEKGVLTMRQALSWSSNTGMTRLQERLGTTWLDYMKKFGFGTSTYSGLGGESSGVLPTTNIVNLAMSSFGQATTVTAFQMMQAYSALANNGTMLKPQYISKIVNPNSGTETDTTTEEVGQPITSKTANQVLEYLRDVVESKNYGTSYGVFSLPGYHISVKTGTAQIAENGGYLTGANDYINSAMLIAPTEDPQYVLYITLKQPTTYNYKDLGKIANPLLARAMEISEDTDSGLTASAQTDTKKVKKVTVSDYTGKTAAAAASAATKIGVEAVVIGDGTKVAAQSTEAGKELATNGKLLLLTDGDKIMPDVSGWSKTDIKKLAKLLDLKVTFKGSGTATKQSIEAHQKITKDSIKITLG